MLGRGRVLYYTAFVWRRLMLRTTVIAITGSVGKSTAKECLAAMLATQGKTLKTNNNENGLISVPLTLDDGTGVAGFQVDVDFDSGLLSL